MNCSAAYIASVARTWVTVDFLLPDHVQRSLMVMVSAFLALRQATGNATYTDFSMLPLDFSQPSLSSEIDTHGLTNLLASADDRNKARLHSLTLQHAGD